MNPDFTFSMDDVDIRQVLFRKGGRAVWDFDQMKTQMSEKVGVKFSNEI